MDLNGKKVLIAYFSHKGMNYTSAGIVDLKEGNTAILAKELANAIDADIFEIEAEKSYPFLYDECTEVAKQELRAGFKPALKRDVATDGYDVLILGFPSWWGTMPMPVWTFLEKHGFSGKSILPFCTNEGSGLGNSERDLKKLCPQATVLGGLSVRGSLASVSGATVLDWVARA